jgi:hypothetical protein
VHDLEEFSDCDEDSGLEDDLPSERVLFKMNFDFKQNNDWASRKRGRYNGNSARTKRRKKHKGQQAHGNSRTLLHYFNFTPAEPEQNAPPAVPSGDVIKMHHPRLHERQYYRGELELRRDVLQKLLTDKQRKFSLARERRYNAVLGYYNHIIVAHDSRDEEATLTSLSKAACVHSFGTHSKHRCDTIRWEAQDFYKTGRVRISDSGRQNKKYSNFYYYASDLLVEVRKMNVVDSQEVKKVLDRLQKERIDKENEGKHPSQHKEANGFTLRIVRRYLKRLGYIRRRKTKGIYFDGHERKDVKHYRDNVFLPQMMKFYRRMADWNGEHMEISIPPENLDEKEIILVVQDESVFSANDDRKYSYVNTATGHGAVGQQKYKGKGIMASCYLTNKVGLLHSKVIKFGKNEEGYWTAEKQIEDLINEVIPKFEAEHPNCVGLFLLDNSMVHRCYGEYALVATRMSAGDGGLKIPKSNTVRRWTLRTTEFERGGEMVIQQMTHDDGRIKGKRTVLRERGISTEDSNGKELNNECKDCKRGERVNATIDHRDPDRTRCCLRRIIAQQPDFRAEVPLIVQKITEAGHRAILLPKFHPEFNYCEYFWGYCKYRTRAKCDYSFKTLQESVPEVLESVPVATLRRFHRRAFRYMKAYYDCRGDGLPPFMIEHAVRKFKGHRHVPREGLHDAQQAARMDEERRSKYEADLQVSLAR